MWSENENILFISVSMVRYQHVVFLCDALDRLFVGMLYDTIHMQMVYIQCASLNVLSDWNFGWMLFHTPDIYAAFHLKNKTKDNHN